MGTMTTDTLDLPVTDDLGLVEADQPGPVTGRLVSVAVDAPGASGTRRFTYAVPEELADLEPGEAVLVDFGRRQALGIVLGPADGTERGVVPRAIQERIRADGPLLPALTLALAGWIADTYLAPPALVLRSMLPPGLLERLELVAERRPDAPDPARSTASDPAGPLDERDREILDQLVGGPRAVRDLSAPEGRAGLLRRLRALAARGRMDLDWTLLAATAGPRYERWLTITLEGLAVVRTLASNGRPPGRPLGPRQVALLGDLAATGPDGASSATVAGRHGTSSIAGLVRRGLVRGDVRERPRRPLGDRPPGPSRRPAADHRPDPAPGRGGRGDPVGPGDPGSDAAAHRRGDRRGQDRGVRRGDRGQPRCRPARAGPRARDRPRRPARGPAPGGPRRRGRARPFGDRRR